MANQLEQLRSMTKIVADTGDIESIHAFKPEDATTNPSLILKAAKKEDYKHLIEEAQRFGSQKGSSEKERTTLTMERLFVNFGTEILKIIPGRVSTEVDARLSFDVEGSIEKAKRFIKLYEEKGIERERILIKLASTWEGALAAKQLEEQGIRCNMTLMFSMPQAIICAMSKVTLISPFVGRIRDWHLKAENKTSFLPHEDPGVHSVHEIYNYYKANKIKTTVMGASFRNIDEIRELAGCDLLTISPELLEELKESEEPIKQKLSPDTATSKTKTKELSEQDFRFLLNENAMATEKLAEGIRLFAKDANTLEQLVMSQG